MPSLRKALVENGVLGINRRNADYVSAWNSRRLYPLVDDKLETKRLAVDAGMAVPELFGVIAEQHEIDDLPQLLDGRDDFVLKPAHGSGGNGILVIAGRSGRRYRKVSGELIDPEELNHHTSSSLSGLYSLGGQRDKVMVEYRVRVDSLFEKITYKGVPDLRTIVFRGYPVMAMARLPTRASDGKANLHQGAVGVGIDLATGRTLGGVLGNEPIDQHPDTDQALTGIQIPGWRELLEVAARCHEITGLGYLGVDVVLDRDNGPMILELNARPGLNIQIANRRGLLDRLQRVGAGFDPRLEVTDRVTAAREWFGRPVSGQSLPA
jgi:alpha-L-glutamate ligase-like protein